MLIAPCGINCEDCEYRENCNGGCHSIQGKPFYLSEYSEDFPVCLLYDCPVNKKGYKTCAECSELPCQLFYDWKDPSMSEEEHLKSIEDRVRVLKGTLR